MAISDPTDISNLEIWHNYSDLGNLTLTGDSVDASANTGAQGALGNISDPGGSQRPEINQETLNGKDVVTYDRSATSWLGQWSGSMAVPAGPTTWFLVCRIDTIAQWQTAISFGTGLEVYRRGDSDMMMFVMGSETYNNVPVDDQWHIFIGRNDGASSELWIDGVSDHTWSGTDPTIASNMKTGVSYFTSNPLSGAIAQFGLYSDALTSGQVTDLYDYQYSEYFAAPPTGDIGTLKGWDGAAWSAASTKHGASWDLIDLKSLL